MWWPDKNQWLLRSRSTLDQYDVQANAKLLFTPMHKNVRLQLPDLQILDMRMNFSSKVFSAITSLCKELGRICTSFDLQCLQHVTVIFLHTEHVYSSTISHKCKRCCKLMRRTSGCQVFSCCWPCVSLSFCGCTTIMNWWEVCESVLYVPSSIPERAYEKLPETNSQNNCHATFICLRHKSLMH